MLAGTPGANSFDGGGGTDRVSYAGRPGAVSVDLSTGLGSGGDAAGDRYVGIEDAEGGSGNDSLTGDAGANRLIGGAGNDRLDGKGGGDTLEGGLGGDTYLFGRGDGAVVIDD